MSHVFLALYLEIFLGRIVDISKSRLGVEGKFRRRTILQDLQDTAAPEVLHYLFFLFSRTSHEVYAFREREVGDQWHNRQATLWHVVWHTMGARAEQALGPHLAQFVSFALHSACDFPSDLRVLLNLRNTRGIHLSLTVRSSYLA